MRQLAPLKSLLCVLVGALALVAMAASAQAQAADGDENPPSVAFSPHFQVFADMKGEKSAAAASRAFHRGASEFAANHPEQMYLVSASDLARAVKSARAFDEQLKIAELSTELGIDKYKRLDLSGAEGHLEDALEIYEKLDYAMANPQRVAEVALYLALSYIEQGDKPLRLFHMLQQITLLDPERKIRKGFYPPDVVQSYQDARASLIRTLRDEGPEKRTGHRLASFADTDFSIFGYGWPTDTGSWEVALHIYSREEQRFLQSETLEVNSLEPEVLREAGNRLMSRFGPCFVEPEVEQVQTVVTSDGNSPFSLEFGFAYASFFQYPEVLRERTEPWGNYGLNVNARLMLTGDFGVTAGIHLLNSMRDYAGFLVEDFSTLRGFMGGDLGIEVGEFNLGAGLNLELTKFGEVRAYADARCAAARERCGIETLGDLGFSMGVNVRPRVMWTVSHQFSLVTSVSTSFYFIPLSDREFNFPVTGQLGVSYRF